MQLASPQHSCVLLNLDGDGYSWLPLAELDIPAYANGGCTGACSVEGGVVLATQSTPARLVLCEPVARRVKESRDLSPCEDSHSIIYHDGRIYVVSTGTNEIYEIPFADNTFGEPRLHWRYPGVGNDRDLVHLNGLTVSEEGLVACCFGPRQQDGTWGSDGELFRLEPYEVILGGLSQPHSPLSYSDRLFVAESKIDRVHSLQRDVDGTWRAEAPIEVGGYSRGLAYRDGKLWVGISAPRRISRSKGTPNPGINATNGAAIVCIDLATGTLVGRRELAGLGDEIYELLPLGEIGPLGRPVDALTQRIAEMQAMTDMIRADIVAEMQKHEEATHKHEEELARGIARYDAQVRELLEIRTSMAELAQKLRQEQAHNEILRQQPRMVDGSRLWRAAQRLRRLAGRPAFVLDAAPSEGSADVPTERSMADVFHEIYVNNIWGSEDSRSGTGSDLTQTAVIRETLPGLLRELGASSMLDVPCGDFHWMRLVELDIDYVGADVVADMIAANTARYADARRRFQVVDISNDDLPRVDLVFCRDLLVHFSFEDALRAVANLKRSGATYLLTTTFTDRSENIDIETGQWRPLNLQLPPFAFPPPLRLINENCTEWGNDWADKSLGLWRLADLELPPRN